MRPDDPMLHDPFFHLRAELEMLQRQTMESLAIGDRTIARARHAVREFALSTSEMIRGKEVKTRIEKEQTQHIEAVTVDRQRQTMMKAIAYEEQIHENPPFIESMLERNGHGDTVGPAQISVSKWSQVYDTTRARLMDNREHFETMDQLLDKVTNEATRKGLDSSSPAVIGTLWNNIEATKVSDYGRRVERYFHDFANESARKSDADLRAQAVKLREYDEFDSFISRLTNGSTSTSSSFPKPLPSTPRPNMSSGNTASGANSDGTASNEFSAFLESQRTTSATQSTTKCSTKATLSNSESTSTSSSTSDSSSTSQSGAKKRRSESGD